MRTHTLSLALVGLACSLLPALQIRAQSLESTADSSVRPGDDFYSYANGAWLKRAVIPAGRHRWAVRDEIADRTRRQLEHLLDEARSAPAGSLARKVADFRAGYLDEAAIERRGTAPLAPLLARIDGVRDKPALARLLGSSAAADVDPLNVGIYNSASVLGLAVEHSIHGETTYTAFLLQGGLGLGDREQYLRRDSSAAGARLRYRAYIGRLLTLAGFDRGDQRAQAVLGLEAALAESQVTAEASAVDRNADHQWTRADFAARAPGMDWNAFFDAAGLASQPVVVAWQPPAVTGVAALVASQPLESWKDYLRFHLIDQYASLLPRAFAEAAADQHGDRRSRAERALAITQEALGSAVGELYARRYFPPAQKARVLGIIGNVTATFREHVARASWLSADSRKIALAKLDRLYVGIGYPEVWEDWGDLTVDPADAFGNSQRVADRDRRHALARLARPYDPHEWVLTPQTVGAFLIFQQNAYEFAAALLQAPKYDAGQSDAAAYGAIGALVGHDVSHFVDVLGADYDPDGRRHRWWTSEDSTRFEAVAEPIVLQFSAYQPLPGVTVDGRLTRTENVADLAGLTAAFEALHKIPRTKAEDREFFIAFAQAFGARLDETALRAQLATDHAPEQYRMNTVRNLDAWYAAFDVVPGDRLYVAPDARIRIW